MHIWTINNWKKQYNDDSQNHRTGIRLKFDPNVDPDVRHCCKDFCQWLRKQYYFPIRVPIYVKSANYIKASDGELVSATCFLPNDRHVEPYIRISTGGYEELLIKKGRDNALTIILASIVHELTHYFQWVNNLQLTDIGMERQAKAYVEYVLDEYAQTREHP